MTFDQLKEYITREIFFLKNQYQNMVEKLVLGSFIKTKIEHITLSAD